MEASEEKEFTASQRSLVSNEEARALSKAEQESVLLSYNILADSYADEKYFPKTARKDLEWSYRREKVLEVLLELDADIIGLQELEQEHYEDYFKNNLGAYESVYKKRTFVKPDGCGIFFRRFNLVHSVSIELNEITEYQEIQTKRSKVDDYATNNVGLISLLELRPDEDSEPYILKSNNSSNEKEDSVRISGRKYIWVANVHAYWNPQHPEVKLMQAWKMTEEIEVARSTFLRGAFADVPVVFVGDFNSLPNSAVYRYLSSGKVSWKEQSKLGLELFAELKHDFPIASAYLNLKEPLTNITQKFSGCLDYIWYDYTKLELRNVLGKLEASKYHEAICLPNERQPSDHIPLFATFSWSPL